ncbi:hypothetical protein BX661DRAFT_180856 [Kickxella alabastrina]|uniref:uncharacterized protein n=1 Tax=Kickxella alabastrina TaxID=61397 RepID=UPI002220FF36|nr:uncharacterized protein BX661DRAFT_180856 [Kickxella alabastrina]KAI7829981.1 hypothetical protein BX661DRAFT_180856 [Kickxella alabastrina]
MTNTHDNVALPYMGVKLMLNFRRMNIIILGLYLPPGTNKPMDSTTICMAMHKWMHQFLVEFEATNTVVLVIGSLIRLVEDPRLMAVRLSEQPKDYN